MLSGEPGPPAGSIRRSDGYEKASVLDCPSESLEELRWMESFRFGANLRKCDARRHIFYLLEKDGAPGLGLQSKLQTRRAKSTEIRTMGLPNILQDSRSQSDPLSRRSRLQLLGFGINPNSTTRLNPRSSPPELRRFLTSNDPLNEFLLHGNDDVAFNSRMPCPSVSGSVAVDRRRGTGK